MRSLDSFKERLIWISGILIVVLLAVLMANQGLETDSSRGLVVAQPAPSPIQTEQQNTVISSSPSTSKQGQVKAVSTVTLPMLSWGGTTTTCGISLLTGGYSCLPNGNGPYGVGTTLSFLNNSQFVNPVTVNKTTVANFNTSLIPADQDVFSATLIPYYSSCGSNVLSVSGYGSTNGCGPVSLGGSIALALKNPYSIQLGFSGGSGQSLFSGLAISVTYGKREVHLTVNGSHGPISVKQGSNIDLSWTSVGFSSCAYASDPAWYTPGWPIGSKMGNPAAGTANTKVYYENVTYRIDCKDTGSGAAMSDSVTVNVTP